MSNFIESNSEILFLYDAKRCNPNGDMDNENKPRMDWEASRNLVSDVRLKRYVRDYLLKQKGKPIFVRKLGDEALIAKEAISLYKLVHIDGKEESELKKDDLGKKEDYDIGKDVFGMSDIRMFGATIPIEVESGQGSSSNFTGPVQFNWGYSLNRIDELQESRTITSHLQTGRSSAGAGVGKDYRVNYSFIAFSGGVNARVAQATQMTPGDLDLLDEALIKSIPLNRTRSKIGQFPRLYLRVQMKDHTVALNDLREFVELKSEGQEFELRDIKECSLDVSALQTYLNDFKDEIDKVLYWKDRNLEITGLDFKQSLYESIEV